MERREMERREMERREMEMRDKKMRVREDREGSEGSEADGGGGERKRRRWRSTFKEHVNAHSPTHHMTKHVITTKHSKQPVDAHTPAPHSLNTDWTQTVFLLSHAVNNWTHTLSLNLVFGVSASLYVGVGTTGHLGSSNIGEGEGAFRGWATSWLPTDHNCITWQHLNVNVTCTLFYYMIVNTDNTRIYMHAHYRVTTYMNNQ